MPVTVIANATIFNGVDEELIEGHVVIEDDRIRAVGPDAGFTGEARHIDVRGRFLMPGLIDTHFHINTMPGLIDTHFHINTPSYDFYESDRMPAPLLAAAAGQPNRSG